MKPIVSLSENYSHLLLYLIVIYLTFWFCLVLRHKKGN